MITEVEDATPPEDRAPRPTTLGAALRLATWPPLLAFAAILAASASLGPTTQFAALPRTQGEVGVLYTAGATGIPWDCLQVDREQYVTTWTMTRVGIPYRIIASCQPVQGA